MPDTTKSRLGKYELLEEIGDGAEGRIFKACCIEAGVPGVAVGEFVALKRLRQTGNETQSEIFKRTTRILRALDHPNIVRYKDSFEGNDEALDEPVYCLVTELLEGETLKELMDKHKSGLPWDRAQKILFQTLAALEYAGSHSVVHRDLKPSNIYLTHQQDVKIIDFGIAKHEDSGATASSGGLLGSWDYMACDFVLMSQESNFRGDQQSDIFSFGVCFYQLLAGNLPYPPLGGNAQIAYFQRYMALDKLPKVKYVHPVFSILRGARACVEKCLTTDRAARYKTFTEVLAAIKLIQRRTLQHGDEEQYEYLEYIGKGGFGKVYRARRMRDGLEVAIKEVMADRNASRFVREAKMLKITQHPHLVQYLDFVEVSERGMGEERRLFLVLEYLLGMPQAGLSYRIKTAPNGLDPVEVLRFFDAFLDCLEYLHQNTIIHRDIKPGNLYAPAAAPEKARIFDLGIAHDTDGTKTHGQVPGTLDYMPAEFATQGGERGSPQSDIYSMGVTLYQALTGKLPFDRLPDDEKMAWTNWYMRCEKPPELAFAHPVFGTHPELEKLLRGALAFRPQDRFASAKAMRVEIGTILENWEQAGKKGDYEKAMADTRAAFARQDFTEAARLVRLALEAWPEAPEARELLDKIETAKLRRIQYDTAITAAKKELERNAPDAAARQIRLALEIWPEGMEARQLMEGIETQRQGRTQYGTAIAAAKKELERDNLDAAAEQVRLALEAFPEGVEAKNLLERIEGERQRRKQYEAALAAASEFLTKGELDDASSKAQLALDAWPEKAEARQLLDKIETERLRRIQYDTALLAAKQELEKDDFDAATRQARLALGVWPEGTEAKQLLEGIETQRQRRSQYEAAITAAKKELERDNLDAATQKARSALEAWPEKVEAKQLLERLETERERRIKYDAAITAAREAVEKDDIDEARQKTLLALEIWPEKVEAKRLLDRIETDKRRKAKYDAAITAAKEALEKNDYETAQTKAGDALNLKPMDAMALELRSLAEKGIRELVDDEPKTVATFLEPPPLAEPKTAPKTKIPLPDEDEPATVAAMPDSPPVEEATVGTILEPPPTKPETPPPVSKPPPEKPPPPVKPKGEPVKEPVAPRPEPVPIQPKPVPAPEKPPQSKPQPAPSKPPERRKKSNVGVIVAIAACVVVVGIAVVVMMGRKSGPATAPPPTTSTPANQGTATPGMPPALVLYQSEITHDIANNNPIGLACLARKPDELQFDSSNPDFLPKAKISYRPANTAAGETNGWILLQPRPGYTGEADVNITAAGKGLLPVNGSVHLKVAGQPAPPRLETSANDYALESGGKGSIEVKVASDYFTPGELLLTVKTVDPSDLLKANLQRDGDKFALQIQSLQPGSVEIGLLLKAPNGTVANKNIHVAMKAKQTQPPQITGLPSGIVIGSFGQRSQPIEFTVTGGSPPFSVDYKFVPELSHKCEARSDATGAGTRFTVQPSQGLQSRNTFTAIVSDAAGHRITKEATIQFVPTNSIGMTLVWVANLPGCDGRWMDLANGGWVGQYAVTQKEFTEVTGSNPGANNQGGDYPVENMSFDQAMRFCDELTRRDGALLPAGWRYSLPNNAQWEFFAEGTPVNTAYAYYGSSKPKPSAPEKVGQLKPNSLGLYDVMGNVFQLTTDPWKDTTGAVEPNFYFCRGGAFRSVSTTLAVHQEELVGNKFLQFSGPRPDVGFRVVLVPR